MAEKDLELFQSILDRFRIPVESDPVQRHRWKKIRFEYLQRHLLYNGLFHLRQLRENSTNDSFKQDCLSAALTELTLSISCMSNTIYLSMDGRAIYSVPLNDKCFFMI